ncbi:MAG: aspartate aminotransferase family protein [Deltaproteobacteria bacterium]|nr:aspartate aminotransferase family protein [Deltaproteobacteria bacterium]
MQNQSQAAAPSALLDVFKQIPVKMERADGVWLFDRDGKRYLDFYGGHAVALLGGTHPQLAEVLSTQAHKLLFQSNAVGLEVRERAASRLAAFAPAGLAKVFFVNSGAEANENALRIALRATDRKRVVAVAGAFHGRTAAAAAITAGHESWYGFARAPFDVTVVPYNDVAALAAAVTDDVAALIFEPVQGVAGARAMNPEFVHAARALTREHRAPLIFDEVQCGMGRSGQPFAAQAFGVTPDILTTAKGLAGGFPAGAVLVSDSLASTLKHGDLGTTFGGGPLACALIEAVIDTIVRDDLLGNVRRLSQRLMHETRVGPVVGVQGMGFLLGLRLSRPAGDVLAALRARGILAGSSADPNVLRLLPPLILADAHVDQLVSTLKEIPS